MSADNRNIVYVVGFTLILVGSLFLVCFTSELIPDYSYTNSLTSGNCAITNTSIIGNVCCQADIASIDKCDADYIHPCAIVTFSEVSAGINGTLYQDFKSVAFVSAINYCSYFHCGDKSYADRLKDVTDFTTKYSVGTSHSCFYGDKTDTGKTALVQRVDSAAVISSLLISCILLILGIIIIAVLCIMSRLRSGDEVSVETIPPSKENLKQGDEFEDDTSDIETIRTNTTTVSVRSSTSKINGGNTPFDGSPEHHPNIPI